MTDEPNFELINEPNFEQKEDVEEIPTTCCDKVKPIFYFDTIKLVTIHSVKYGVLHRSIQIAVLVYVCVYSIWLQKGYQEYSPVTGVLFSKVKGVGYVNSSLGLAVYDSSDLVQPPVEPNALFIVGGELLTRQTRGGVCTSLKESCTSDSDCTQNLTPEGEILPSCNLTQGFCLVKGWCPLEIEDPKKIIIVEGIEKLTIFLRTTVSYDLFKVQLTEPTQPVMGRDLFYLQDMLDGLSIDNCSLAGCIVRVQIDWTCDLDHGNCVPKVTFSHAPGGFNYRRALYDMDQTERVLQKLYGVRFIIKITGRGGRFSFFQMVITLGSGAAFFTVATIIVDMLIWMIHKGEDKYIRKKWSHIK